MRKIIALAALGAATLTAASPAGAAIYLYELANAPGFSGGWTFSFEFDTARAPSVKTTEIMRFAPTTITYTVPGSTNPITSSASNLGPTFFAPIQQGGISILRLPSGPDLQPRWFGPALFTGSTSSPTFLTGEFSLSTQPRNSPADIQIFDYVLRVTSLSAVPEPSTWGMMILGFGGIGFAMRSRRSRQVPIAQIA